MSLLGKRIGLWRRKYRGWRR